jgi:release factor glutamine methyltransferase
MNTLKTLLSKAKQKIDARDAEIIFCEVLQLSLPELITKDEEQISEKNEKKIEELVDLRANGKSISEIFQKKMFFGEEFFVTNDVLTPRPETEFIVEYVLSELENFPEQKQKKISAIIDIGTGSGCIITSICKNFLENPQIPQKDINFYASDISKKAIQIAQKNARKILGEEEKIQFRQSDLLESFSHKELNNACIVTNLPYIPQIDEEWIDKEVLQGDPHLALFSGEKGLDVYEKFFVQLAKKQKNFYTLVFEFDPPQEPFFKNFLEKLFPQKKLTFFTDLQGAVRFGALK